ncbi:MAG: single-stranded DNA-binding protein [Candidatus Magasanikbacteria bacterium]
MNLNKVILIGRLTDSPELRNTEGGRSVVNFSMATNRYWTNDQGEKQEDTEFHNIVVWGRQAEVVNQFLEKGALVMVEGRLQTRDWETREGDSRRTTEVVARNIQFGPRSDAQSAERPGTSGAQQSGSELEEEEDIPEINVDEEGEEIDEEDIPF